MSNNKEYTPRQPIEIILNSDTGTIISSLDGHKFYELETEISARKGELILLYLKKAFIPFSFYCLSASQKNNKLDIRETHSNGGDTNTYSITIPDGNYNITQLLSQIKTLLEAGSAYNHTYTITYNRNTAKVSFLELEPQGSNIKAELLFASGANASNSCRRLLGFDAVDVEFTASVSASSQNIVDMADGLDSLHISSNLVGDNIRSTNDTGELLIVPVNLEPFSILYFDDIIPFKHKLSQSSIKRIEIKMADANGNVIDFNNIPYTLILVAEFIENPLDVFNASTRTIENANTNMLKKEQDNIELFNMMVGDKNKNKFI